MVMSTCPVLTGSSTLERSTGIALMSIVRPSTATYYTLLGHSARSANSNETMSPTVLGRFVRVLRPILALALACRLY